MLDADTLARSIAGLNHGCKHFSRKGDAFAVGMHNTIAATLEYVMGIDSERSRQIQEIVSVAESRQGHAEFRQRTADNN